MRADLSTLTLAPRKFGRLIQIQGEALSLFLDAHADGVLDYPTDVDPAKREAFTRQLNLLYQEFNKAANATGVGGA